MTDTKCGSARDGQRQTSSSQLEMQHTLPMATRRANIHAIIHKHPRTKSQTDTQTRTHQEKTTHQQFAETTSAMARDALHCRSTQWLKREPEHPKAHNKRYSDMADLNYDRWNHLADSSDDDEIFGHVPPSTSPRRSIVQGPFAVRSPPQPRDITIRRAIRAETNELRAFLARNPCPPEAQVKTWLRSMATRATKPRRFTVDFAMVMESKGWTTYHLGWFHYDSLQTLWSSGTKSQEAAFDDQRQVGIELYHRGGRECMRFHFYALNHVMCNRHFIPLPPPAAFGFTSHLEKVWDGIGSWQA